MSKILLRVALFGLMIVLGLLLVSVSPVHADPVAQQPTVSIPTVTGPPPGPAVKVDPNANEDQINVRSGPGTDYAKVGVLIIGEEATALGKSVTGEWIQIAYPGVEGGTAWVFSGLVSLSLGTELPIIEPPPTPTPLVTATIDPTLAAQFINEPQSTRLPTFTPPPPLVIPTFEESGGGGAVAVSSFPMGLVISILGSVGLIGALVSFLRER
ncbi:MAG: SH3 domain-containing protein [Chloroflexi bacterium]|nr:MAG: SH3 domain-containing protein [Chloroflexota bacterium]MBL1195775.1 SH3 domain-containing protein [Chloroflexota bacterium]NOH13066.1 SH3 domain-containing protein [Chloroflexota bacterium]